MSPLGREAAFEEDRDEADDPDRPCEVGIVEVDVAGTVRPEEHPDPEEEHQHGEPQAPREQGSDDAEEEDAADEEQAMLDRVRGRRHGRYSAGVGAGVRASASARSRSVLIRSDSRSAWHVRLVTTSTTTGTIHTATR